MGRKFGYITGRYKTKEGDSKNWYIPKTLADKIRKRDKFCVYCHKKMKRLSHAIGTPSDKATVEHMDDNSVNNPNELNVTMCCGSCNSSRGPKKLVDWFESNYCKKRKVPINENTVAKPVKKYLKFS